MRLAWCKALSNVASKKGVRGLSDLEPSYRLFLGWSSCPRFFPGTLDIKPKVPRDELLADVAACQGPKIEGTKVSGLVVGGDGGRKGHIA